MTYAPAPLIALGKYLVSQGAVNLGVVGDTAHDQKGVSYHLGADKLAPGAYSMRLPRDVAGLSNAASAIDIGKVGGGYPGLRALSSWLSSECQRRAIDTLDIREVIYSPDGQKVLRWDEPTQTVYPGGTGTGQGDNSHLTHTHVSFYRDSETRDKLALFRRYFEEEEVIKAIVGADWMPTKNAAGVSNGVLRRTPSRSADLVKDAAGNVVRAPGPVRTIAEVEADGHDWRLTEYGTAPAYFLASDLAPIASDADAALNAFLNRTPAPLPDCSAEVLAARHVEYARVKDGTTIAFPEPPV